jgi:hypothetical protein
LRESCCLAISCFYIEIYNSEFLFVCLFVSGFQSLVAWWLGFEPFLLGFQRAFFRESTLETLYHLEARFLLRCRLSLSSPELGFPLFDKGAETLLQVGAVGCRR